MKNTRVQICAACGSATGRACQSFSRGITAHDPADSLRIDIGKNQIPLAYRRQDEVKYIELDEHKVFDPTPAIQLDKEILGEIGK